MMSLIEEVELDGDPEREQCPGCEIRDWVRGVVRTDKHVTWVLWCGACGKPFRTRTNLLP